MSSTPIGVPPTGWDEVSQVAADAYFPHTLVPRAAGDPGRALLRATAASNPVRIARIDWATDVSVESEHPGAYGVNIPLSGRLDSIVDGREMSSTPGTATVCPPDTPTRIPHWAASCGIIGVRFDRDYLDREIERILGRPGRRVPMRVDLTTPTGASWLRFVRSVSEQMDGPNCVLRNDLVAHQLLSAVTTAFVLAAIPDDPQGQATRPRIVKRVIDAMHADPAHRWTASEMAATAGVSVRRLQEGFREYVGRTPSEYLTDIRLCRVRTDLLAADPGDTVAAIALRWGFAHGGRFAAAYRTRFGTSPSTVIRTN